MKYYMYCLLLAVSFCLTTYGQSSEWNEWKQKYNKQYSTSTEELYRHAVWKKNLQYVEKHNSDLNTEFKLEMNEFADQEASRRPKIDLQSISVGIRPTRHDLVYLPSSFDWRKKGVIEPVRNQGQMGSSLSIVATECMNSYSCIKTGHLVSASEQEVWDCCTKTATLSTLVFDCIHNIGGLCSSADYPNKGSLGSCKNSTCSPIVKNQGSVQVLSGREDQLQIAVLVCPVLVAIDASHASFQLYRSGVYDEPACSSTALDHVVQLVGYGSANGMDYWIVKNSWGVAWGMEGYILMSRNKNNQCGIASAAVYPV